MLTQLEIIQDMQNKGFNVVTCGECGSTLLLDKTALNDDDMVSCEYCEFQSEECDFPDLVY